MHRCPAFVCFGCLLVCVAIAQADETAPVGTPAADPGTAPSSDPQALDPQTPDAQAFDPQAPDTEPGGGEPVAGEAESEASSGPGTVLQFRFSDAEWPAVLQWLAERAGLTLDLTDVPPGQFNYIDERRRTVSEAIDVLNGYLLPRGYVLLRRDRFLVVMKTDNPVLPNMIPTVPAAELDRYGDNELLRIVAPVENVEPAKVAEQLAKILGPHGLAAPLDTSRALVLQGFGKSLREAVGLLSATVAPPADDELVFRSFPLQHIPATDAERQIQNLFGLTTNPFRASMQRRAEYYRRRSRDGDRDRGDDDSRRSSAPPLVQNLAMNMKVSALRHTNSLLVTATPAALTLVEGVLETIDVPPPSGEGSVYASTTPVLRVYTVDNADEDDVAETVDAVMPGVVINEDGRHDSIHVLATPAEHIEVEKLINIIDGGGVGEGVEVIPLTRTDPLTMSDLLESLFANEDRDDRPVIAPGFQNNSLIVRGTSAQMAEIKKALASFGEEAGLRSQTGDDRRFRRLQFGNARDAERIARIARELLEEDERFDNPIRVVIPSERPASGRREEVENPRRGTLRVPPGQTRRSDRPRGSSVIRRDDPSDAGVALVALDGSLNGSLERPCEDEPRQEGDAVSQRSEDPAVRSAGQRRGGSQAAPRVTIEVRDGQLFLYSNDDVALDEVEETIRDLVRQMPSRTQWTVFYLRAAPAESTARTLVDLLQTEAYPRAVVGAGPDFGVGGSRTTRIVPDARTNALFVSGPEAQLEQVERFLRFLDTTELPESLRDRIPRAIPVRYADATAIAEMLRELYKDFLEDPLERARRSRGEDRGGDRGEDDADVVATTVQSRTPGLRPTGIQLTLAVDEDANTLLVSCNEQLFEQIRTLVEQRDEAAQEYRPVIQVIQVEPRQGTQIKTTLDNLLNPGEESSATRATSRPLPRDRSRSERSESRGD